jgi:hypothetical protein
MDPDPGGPKTCRSGGSGFGFGSGSATLPNLPANPDFIGSGACFASDNFLIRNWPRETDTFFTRCMDFACPSSFFYCSNFLLFSFNSCCIINKVKSVVFHITHIAQGKLLFGWRIYGGLFVVADRSLSVGEKCLQCERE